MKDSKNKEKMAYFKLYIRNFGMNSQAYIVNTSPSGTSLNKAAQSGTRLSSGGTNSAGSNFDTKTP